MSPEQYAERSTDRLLPLFVDYAKRLGLGRVFRAMGGVAPLDASIAVEPQEGKRLAAELLAIAVALGVRPTTPAVAALLRDDDPDVRMAAATFFNEIDPQLAEATRKGVMTGCSADEVIAMRERVRTPPPPLPTLQEMSDEALLARFEDAGERLVGCRFIDLGPREAGHGHAQRHPWRADRHQDGNETARNAGQARAVPRQRGT